MGISFSPPHSPRRWESLAPPLYKWETQDLGKKVIFIKHVVGLTFKQGGSTMTYMQSLDAFKVLGKGKELYNLNTNFTSVQCLQPSPLALAQPLR